MVGQVGNLSYQFSLFQGEFSELVKDSSENVGQDAILSHEFSSFPGVAHCDMNDPFEIERLAPDNRLCQGGKLSRRVATSSSCDRVLPGAIWQGALVQQSVTRLASPV
jgi:hypothetical protein